MKSACTTWAVLFFLFKSSAYADELVHDTWKDSSGSASHVLTINPAYFELQIVVDPVGMITRPCEMASKHSAVAAINGGFFAFPDNAADDLYFWIRKESVADGNLITNQHTHSLSRDELPTFAWSHSGESAIAGLSQTTPWLPAWAQFAINGMPVLLQDGKLVEWDKDTLNAVGGEYELARSGLCMGFDGNFRLFTASRATIESMAELAQAIGCKDAINLDGGPSTSLDYDGRSLMHKSCFLERPVHNSIVVKSKRH